MPFATEEVICKLEENLKDITSVTALLDQGYTPEQLLEALIGDLGLEITDDHIDTVLLQLFKGTGGACGCQCWEKEIQE